MANAEADPLSRLSLPQLPGVKPSSSLEERLESARRLALLVRALHRQGQIHRWLDAATVTIEGKFPPQLDPPPEPRRFGGDQSDPSFCPPELAQGSAVELPAEIEAAAAILRQRGTPLDPRRIDVYQFGVWLCQSLTGEPFLNYVFSPTCKANVPPTARAILESCLGENLAAPLANGDGLVEAIEDLIRQLPGKQAASETPPLGSAVISPAITPPKGRAVPVPAKTPSDEKLPFQQLGHFQIVEQIGSGGMGDVYKGYDPSLDRDVAIKVLAASLTRDEHFVLRFNAEATAAAKLSHPNVVRIYFIGQDAGHHFFAMQFIEGQSLAQRLSREKRLPVDAAVAIIEQCLAGLEAAHAHGLIHRDVKPGNILLDRSSGQAVLVDFGLVRHLNAETRMTATGVVMGTVDYVAPEQARGRAIDGRADIYSLGVMFYELLAGRLPFISDSPTAMIFQHAYEEPFPLKRAAPDVPPPLAAIIAHMMEKEPDERYASCAAVLADLRAFREGQPVAAASVAVAVNSDGVAVELPPQRAAIASVPPDYLAADLESGRFLPPRDDPWQRAKDWVATMFRRHAPQYFQEIQNTTLQMDAAVVHYQQRCNRLASLLEEARGIETELAEQIEAQLAGAAAAASRAEASAGEHDRQAALAKRCEYEESAASLRSQHDLQRQQVEELELQRNKADAMLARLQSQQSILKARLKAAEDRSRLQGEPPRLIPRPICRRRLVPLVAVAFGVLALASLLPILWNLGPPQSPASANLVMNGDFENPAIAPDGFYATLPGGAVFSGWTVGGDSIDLIDTRHAAAHSGKQSLDLTGNAAGSIAQNVATTPGKTYRLTFWYCAHWFHPYAGDAYADVFWDGVVIDRIHRPGSLSAKNMNWTSASYKLLAKTTSTLLKFSSLSPNGGIFLDDISLVAVPQNREEDGRSSENVPLKMLAFYPFEQSREGTTADVLGGPPAKFAGKARVVASGKYGSAAEFRNAGDWIDTGRSILDTTKTWSVAAWIMLFDGFTADYRTAISQDGQRHSAFYLQYCQPGGGSAPDSLCLAKWETALAGLGAERTAVHGKGRPEANRWIHLAAVQDVGQKKLQLYIDGELADEQPYDAANGAFEWPAKGNTMIGRGLWDGHLVNQFLGRIDEVYFFQGALSPKDVRAIRDNKFPPQRPRS